jgi:hypothetical protein
MFDTRANGSLIRIYYPTLQSHTQLPERCPQWTREDNKVGCYKLSRLLKGQCHEIEIVFEGLYILIITFCVCADGFQGLSKAFHYPLQFSTFYLLL